MPVEGQVAGDGFMGLRTKQPGVINGQPLNQEPEEFDLAPPVTIQA